MRIAALNASYALRESTHPGCIDSHRPGRARQYGASPLHADREETLLARAAPLGMALDVRKLARAEVRCVARIEIERQHRAWRVVLSE